MDERLTIGVVHRDEVDAHFAWSLLRLARESSCRFIIYPSGPAIDIARNKVVEQFLESDSEHLLFVDSDIEFTPAHVKTLWENRAPERIVGGFCLARDGTSASRMRDSETRRYFPIDYSPMIVKVDVTGAAFLMVGREALEKVRAQGHERPWFAFTDGYGEDGEFCRRVQEAGYEVWVDGSVCPGHRKTTTLRAGV